MDSTDIPGKMKGDNLESELDNLKATLLNTGTAVVADIFDSYGLLPPVFDNSLTPMNGNNTCFIGPAYTINGEKHTWTGAGDRTKLAAIDAMTPGVVPVWAGNNIRGVCCFGDLLAEAMKARGCAGVVVDGGVRDVNYLSKMGLPIVARYRSSAQSIGRWHVTDSQAPIKVRGALVDRITINPGDLILADNDGVISIPLNLVNDVQKRALEWAESESEAREDIKNGLPLLKALDIYGHL
jgi:regulator of RNase E activity RraA